MPPTAKDVAAFMMEQVQERRMYQDRIVRRIKNDFGAEFTYKNKNGNLAIKKEVLDEFEKLSGDAVVWERGERCWRLRRERDKPGRQQG